ncbi:hypothetical protein ACIBQ6_21945 [Nonomuraea sp. NPDC049655]|uniref:hypothetical protein n=1 Tax=Nonomuraea sp. NPDC049655 TaxID=3364355 RepID=UPI0037BC1CA6
MATEYGVFNDEGLVEDHLWSLGEAEAAAAQHRAQGDEFAEAREICPDHEGQPKDGCEACEDEESSDEQGDEDEDSWHIAA